MEENHIRFRSEATASSVLNQLLNNTYSTVNLHKIQQKVSKILPTNYISYMRKVSKNLDTLRQPKGPEKTIKTLMTEPNESKSYMSRPQFEWEDENEPWRQNNALIHKKQSQRSGNKTDRKQSMRMSVMSRNSKQTKSRKYLSSKRLISSRRVIRIEPPKLIPLKSLDEDQNQCDEKINQLRNKKIKLQQALRLFMEVETIQVQKTERKEKESHTMFTTDYKGKIINFNQRKDKSKEIFNFPIKVQTVVDSPKPWGKINLTATSKRGFKQAFFDLTNL